MPSVFALRMLLGAGLGLGALDVVWINAALAPRLVQDDTAPAAAAAAISEPSASPREDHAPVHVAEPAPSEPEPSELAAKTEPIINTRVYFATASAALDARARNLLARLVADAGPAAQFLVEGHADYRGDESRNESLSKDRALSVEQHLVQLGIDRARIRVDYVGEGDATGELWRDRRVEIQITGGTR